MNPTGSFKDRIAAVAVSIAVERVLGGLVGTSSGNGGAAAAAYSARAGIALTVFSLAQPAAAKVDQIRALGATIVLVEGLGADARSTESAATQIAAHAVAHGRFPFLTGGRFSPEAMEGAKTIAYELIEQVPAATAIYVPVGGGGLLAALGRGMRDAVGRRSEARLVAVQPSGCATVRDALGGGPGMIAAECSTGISGLQVPVMFDRDGALAALSTRSGHLTEVSDDAVRDAQRMLARQCGVLVEPAGATALAGVIDDVATGRVGPDDVVVVLATGAGYKDGHALARLGAGEPLTRITSDAIGTVLGNT
jgi:threonine synthase